MYPYNVYFSKVESIRAKLSRPDIFKPLILMVLLMFFQQFSGVATLTYYAYDIMEKSGSNLNEYNAVIIYGVTRLAASSLGAIMMRRFNRKPLLIISSLCVSLGMSVLGYTTFSNDREARQGTDSNSGFVANYLPLISVNFIAISYQLGLGPVGWSYICKYIYAWRAL